MCIWAIADLHLSWARPDRRERFAERWRDHAKKIEDAWRGAVRPEDLVLLPGDLSMARNHRDLQPDLAWLDRLPGTKVLSAGNHDLWWNNVEAIRPMLRGSLRAVGGVAIPVPDEEARPESARTTAFGRELEALDKALDQAARLRTGGEPLYLLWHYPPFDRYQRPGPWVDRFEAAGVTACLYGHLHIQGQWSLAVQGRIRGVHYQCVAADAIGFRPIRVGPRLGM